MLLFGHTGLTVAAAAIGDLALRHLRARRSGAADFTWRNVWLSPVSLAERVDIRLLLFGSLLPDIVDKPLGMLVLSDLGNGRIISHTLVFLALLSLLGLLVHRISGRGWGLVLAFGAFTHLVFDSMWRLPRTLLWPFLGLVFPPGEAEGWLLRLLRRLVSEPSVYIPEILGLLSLTHLVFLLARRHRLRAFLFEGRIVPPPAPPTTGEPPPH